MFCAMSVNNKLAASSLSKLTPPGYHDLVEVTESLWAS